MDNKELLAICQKYANCVKVLLGLSDIRFEIMNDPTCGVACTHITPGKNANIYMNFSHKMFNVPQREDLSLKNVLGVLTHEMLHKLYTEPFYEVQTKRRKAVRFPNLFHDINNILEDFTIESRCILTLEITKDIVDIMKDGKNGFDLSVFNPIKCLDGAILTGWKFSPPVSETDPEVDQFIHAMIQFTDMGPLVPGSKLKEEIKPKLAEIYNELVQGVFETPEQRIERAYRIYQIVEKYCKQDLPQPNLKGTSGQNSSARGRSLTKEEIEKMNKDPRMGNHKKIVKRVLVSSGSGDGDANQKQTANGTGNGAGAGKTPENGNDPANNKNAGNTPEKQEDSGKTENSENASEKSEVSKPSDNGENAPKSGDPSNKDAETADASDDNSEESQQTGSCNGDNDQEEATDESDDGSDATGDSGQSESEEDQDESEPADNSDATGDDEQSEPEKGSDQENSASDSSDDAGQEENGEETDGDSQSKTDETSPESDPSDNTDPFMGDDSMAASIEKEDDIITKERIPVMEIKKLAGVTVDTKPDKENVSMTKDNTYPTRVHTIICKNYTVAGVSETTQAAYKDVIDANKVFVTRFAKKVTSIAQEEEQRDVAMSGRVSVMRYAKHSDTSLRVFEKRTQKERTDSRVIICLDCSGSMSGRKIENAKVALACIVEGLAKAGIPVKVMTFCEEGHIVHHHYVGYKNNLAAKSSIMMISAGGCNCDGYSIRYALKDLLKQKCKNHLMIVISDGQPYSQLVTNAVRDTANAVIEAKRKTKVIGVGVDANQDVLRGFYKDTFIELSSIEELMTRLGKIIVKEVLTWE